MPRRLCTGIMAGAGGRRREDGLRQHGAGPLSLLSSLSHRLRWLVHAAETARGEQDFPNRLRADGLLVRPRTGATTPTRLAGYAVALPDDHNAAGDTLWYSGSTPAAHLSLPSLRRRWQAP